MRFQTLRKHIKRITNNTINIARFEVIDVVLCYRTPILTYKQLLLFNKPEKDFYIIHIQQTGSLILVELEMNIK